MDISGISNETVSESNGWEMLGGSLAGDWIPGSGSLPAPLWYPEQLEWMNQPAHPGNGAYNFAVALELKGLLDIAVLQESVGALVERHAILRTVFRAEHGEVEQEVLPSYDARMDIFEASPAGELAGRIAEAARKPLDQRVTPLFRAMLFSVDTDEHVLLLKTHHFACDEWSMNILVRELSQIYSVKVSRGAQELPALKATYADYASELTRRMRAGEFDGQIEYWKKRMGGRTEFLHIATDKARPTQSSYRGKRESARYPAELVKEIRKVSQRNAATPFMLLLVGFQALLARYSGENDIAIAGCVANRGAVELENVVGPFSNRIVLRTDFSGNPSMRELLKQVRNASLDAFTRQEVPYGEVVKQIRGDGNGTHGGPICQVMVTMQNAPEASPVFAGLDCQRIPVEMETAPNDLHVLLAFTDEGELKVEVLYNTDLFGADSIRRILGDFREVLEALVRNPEARAGEILGVAAPAKLPEAPQAISVKAPTEARDAVETKLQILLGEVFGGRAIGIHDDFFELGGDSIQAARFISRIQSEMGVRLPLSILIEASTIERVAKEIWKQSDSRTWSSLVEVQKLGSRPPIFCVHSHTGDVLYSQYLSRFLGTEQPIYGLQSRAVTGAPPDLTIEEMATHYVEELRKIQGRGPYHLFGFCFGGMVAFEMERLLRRLGHEVAFLGLYNTPAPGTLKGWPLGQWSYLMRRTRNELQKMRAMAGREQREHLTRNVRNFGLMVGRSVAVDGWRRLASLQRREGAEKLATRMLTLEEINIAAAKNFFPQHQFPGQITLFLSQEVAGVYPIAPEEGWKRLTTQGVELIEVPLDKDNWRGEPFVRVIGGRLERGFGVLRGRGVEEEFGLASVKS